MFIRVTLATNTTLLNARDVCPFPSLLGFSLTSLLGILAVVVSNASEIVVWKDDGEGSIGEQHSFIEGRSLEYDSSFPDCFLQSFPAESCKDSLCGAPGSTVFIQERLSF